MTKYFTDRIPWVPLLLKEGQCAMPWQACLSLRLHLLVSAVFWTQQNPRWLRQNISAQCQLQVLVKQHTAGGDLNMRQVVHLNLNH